MSLGKALKIKKQISKIKKTMDKVQKKLNRIEGQVGAVKRMYDDGRECLEIVQQIAAAKSALTSVARDLLTGEASKCARNRKPEDFDKVLSKLLELQ